jgi:hypothetical protein
MEYIRSRRACAARAQSRPRGPARDAAALPADAGAVGLLLGRVGPDRGQPIHHIARSIGDQPMKTFCTTFYFTLQPSEGKRRIGATG